MPGSVRVLLINPPGLPGTTPNREGSAGMGAQETREGGFSYPPHTLATVAATLRAAGHSVTALDAGPHLLPAGCDPQAGMQFVDGLRQYQADVIGVYVSWATRDADNCFLSLLKDVGLGAHIVALGPSTRYMAQDLAGADHVLEGEPELAFPLLCQRLCDGDSGLPRIVTPALLGAPGYNADGLLTDLDALPPPAWDLLPYGSYPYLTVMASRGCTADCRWCPYVVAQGNRYRRRSPESVVAEVRGLVQRYRPQRIVFRDPVFAHDRAQVVALCNLMVRDRVLKPGKNLLWECESRPDGLDPALIRLMHVAGCIGVKLGLETVDPDVLQRQGRVSGAQGVRDYLARTESVVAACRRYGVSARLFVLLGLPGETTAGAHATADLVERMGPCALTIKTLERYPGVRLAPTEPLPSVDPAALAALQRAQRTVRGLAGRSAPRWRRALGRLVDRAWFVLRGTSV